MISTHLAHFKITAKLGEGGMGEVYRAEDTKLGREVAIKVLPEAVAGDPERLARFEREAKVLASLNHPHIAAIYSIESATPSSRPIHFLVMELAEGEDLAARIARGAIPVEEAIPTALQIAEALEAAHERGIIHRDLKPANLKVDSEGQVKVLDFGLAKALDPSIDPDSSTASAIGGSPSVFPQSMSPTLTAQMTGAGVILGTASYMSPEQAKGKAADKRADIWAFGVVVYEMLTGRQLFAADSVAETLGAIFQQPIDLDALPAATPARLRHLLERCLERDPKQRLRDIGEARIVLQDPGAAEPPPGATVPQKDWLRALLVLLPLAAVAGVAGYYVGGRPDGLPAGRTQDASNPSFQQLTFQPGEETRPALSPDGRTLFFSAAEQAGEDLDIFMVPVGGKNPLLITPDSPEDDYQPVVSPDGNSIAFRSDRDGGGLFIMGSTGESVRRLTDFGYKPDWSPDGDSIVFTSEVTFDPFDRGDPGRIYIVEVATGASRPIEVGDAVEPAWSPHHDRIAYWGVREETGQRDLWTVSIDGAQPIEVTNDPAVDWNPVWSEDGKHLYFLSDRGGLPNLWRVPIDEASGRVLGEPESAILPTGFALHVSRGGGRWVYASVSTRSTIERLDFDPQRLELLGPPVQILETTNRLLAVDLTSDGTQLAYTTVRPQQDLFVVSAAGGRPTQLTDDAARDRWASWSEDGEQILFMSSRKGRYEIWGIRPDGSGLTQLTRTTVESMWDPQLRPDGSLLAVVSELGTALFDATSEPPWENFERLPSPTGKEGDNFRSTSWSPDGSRLAGYLVSEGQPSRLTIFDLASRTYLMIEEALFPRLWFPDGVRLLATPADDDSRVPLVVNVASGDIREAPEAATLLASGALTASRDLRTLVRFDVQQESDIWLAENIE